MQFIIFDYTVDMYLTPCIYFFLCSGQERGGMTSSWGRTPSFGAQTPMVGSMTPSYGSMTPMHGGGRTPAYGSQTPMHDGKLV